jgi:uncharacterized protein YaiE (UPF0345 family)
MSMVGIIILILIVLAVLGMVIYLVCCDNGCGSSCSAGNCQWAVFENGVTQTGLQTGTYLDFTLVQQSAFSGSCCYQAFTGSVGTGTTITALRDGLFDFSANACVGLTTVTGYVSMSLIVNGEWSDTAFSYGSIMVPATSTFTNILPESTDVVALSQVNLATQVYLTKNQTIQVGVMTNAASIVIVANAEQTPSRLNVRYLGLPVAAT